MDGYTPQTFTEARTQLRSVCGILADLLGNNHPYIAGYHHFLRQYDRLRERLEGELEFVYGWRLAPSLVAFHVQLIWRNWLISQIDI
jgi:hypothetical protein